jgi:glycosyl transferase, family 25
MSVIVRIISLEDSQDRRAAMCAQMEKLTGLEWSFFDACTTLPDFLSHDSTQARKLLRRDMSKGELGCFASHATLWHWFASSCTHDFMIVLEDDVILDPVFFQNIEQLMSALPDVDYLRFYAKAPVPATPLKFLMGRHIIRYTGVAFGTQAYIMRKAAAKKLLESITIVTRPIDDEMDRYWVHDVPNIGVFPFPVMEISSLSTIGNSRRAIDRSWQAYVRWKTYRIINSVRRRWRNMQYMLSARRY